jgi:hypothetical protein
MNNIRRRGRFLAVDNDEEFPHVHALAQAFRIYQERSRTRGQNWARFDEHDAWSNMRSKLSRIQVGIEQLARIPQSQPAYFDLRRELTDAIEDDALDLINYTVFLIRHIRHDIPEVEKVTY